MTTSPLDIVIPFHAGDQNSAASLMSLILELDEGTNVRYTLRYADSTAALTIIPTISRFLDERDATLDHAPLSVPFPEALAATDPNQGPFEGNHAKRTPDQKRRIFCWNATLYECIQKLDRFLILEPDCVILKNRWAAPFKGAWRMRQFPIIGHLKRGQINGQLMPTHFAGCSLYDGARLRDLPLLESFSRRTENPWWKLRALPNTANANNAFYGPVMSGYDLSYDYFLFALSFRELTGSDNPLEWPLEALESREDLVVCDFRSRLSTAEIFARYLSRVSIMHGIKDDNVRREALRSAKLGHVAQHLATLDPSLIAA